MKDLADNKIYIKNEKELNEEQYEYVRRYFCEKLTQNIMPFMVRKENKLSTLKDDAVYLAITIKHIRIIQ